MRRSQEQSADMDLSFFDLNTATREQLARVPFIGEERADQIIEHRPFHTMDEVRQTPGLTDDVVDQLIRGGATVGEATHTGGR